MPTPPVALRLESDLVDQLAPATACSFDAQTAAQRSPMGSRGLPGVGDPGARVLWLQRGVKPVLGLEGGMRRAWGPTC